MKQIIIILLSIVSSVQISAQTVGVSGAVTDATIDINQTTDLIINLDYTGAVTINPGELFINIGIPFQVAVGTASSFSGSLLNFFDSYNVSSDATGTTITASNSAAMQFNDAGMLSIPITGLTSTNGNTVNVSINVTPLAGGPPAANATNTTGFQVTSILPVEMSSFRGTQTDCGMVTLNWKTESEINNEGFFIERGVDGRNFEVLGFVTGKNEAAQYSYQDTDVKASWSKVYYRLQQKDFDGKFDYSNVLSIEHKCDLNVDARVFPNPTVNSLNVELTGLDEDVSATIVNSEGMVMKEVKIASGVTNKYDVSHLASGLYSLVLKIQGTPLRKQFIKID